MLRQKEKYLFPDDGSRSPIKRSKGKFPDIERALSVWAKNTRKQGITLTDVMIREKARFFATSLGISDSQFKANGAGDTHTSYLGLLHVGVLFVEHAHFAAIGVRQGAARSRGLSGRGSDVGGGGELERRAGL